MNERRAKERQVREKVLADTDIARIRTDGVRLKRSHHIICPVMRLNPALYAVAKKELKRSIDARRDPAKVRASVRRWKKNNPAAVSIQRYRRRTNLSRAIADLTESQWRAIQTAYKHRCAYCGKRKPLTQDHVVPVSQGGAHTASNIIPACVSCNSSKGARLPQVIYQPHLIA